MIGPLYGSLAPLTLRSGGLNLFEDLWAGWKLDESSGGSSPVTRADVLGALTLSDPNNCPSITAKFGNGAKFPVEAGARRLTRASVVLPNTLTVSLWYKIEGGNNGDTRGYLFAGGDGASAVQFNLNVYGGVANAYWADGSNYVASSKSPSPTGTAWHHVVGRGNYATKKIRLSFDGAHSAESAALSGNPYRTAVTLYIGRIANFGGAAADHLWVDEVSVFSTYKDDAWVAAMYNGGAGIALPF